MYLERFTQAKDTYAKHAIVQERMRHKIISILNIHQLRDFRHIFEFGAGNLELTSLLSKLLRYDAYVCNDINDYHINPSLLSGISYHIFDMANIQESSLYSMKFELIVSNATLQWLDFEKTMYNLKHMLSPNGWCILSTFGEKNCYEIRASTNYGLEYVNLEDMKKILSKYFEILYLEDEIFKLHFPTPIEVFRHLKLSGVNALHKGAYLSKTMLMAYDNSFGNTLTYHPVYMLLSHKPTTSVSFYKS